MAVFLKARYGCAQIEGVREGGGEEIRKEKEKEGEGSRRGAESFRCTRLFYEMLGAPKQTGGWFWSQQWNGTSPILCACRWQRARARYSSLLSLHALSWNVQRLGVTLVAPPGLQCCCLLASPDVFALLVVTLSRFPGAHFRWTGRPAHPFTSPRPLLFSTHNVNICAIMVNQFTYRNPMFWEKEAGSRSSGDLARHYRDSTG